MRTVAVYPGSFDPPTNGHLDIIERSSRVFSRVIVAVAVNLRKNAFFTPAERVRMLKGLTSTMGNVEVTSFHGLLVDFARAKERTSWCGGYGRSRTSSTSTRWPT